MTDAAVDDPGRGAATTCGAYKALRDAMLAAHPEAFTSDAQTEAPSRRASYLLAPRRRAPDGGRSRSAHSLGGELVGAVSLRARRARQGAAHRPRHRHDGARRPARPRHRPRAARRAASHARAPPAGVELLTLNVTAGNARAVRLYERAGFARYGRLAHAIKRRRPLPRQGPHGPHAVNPAPDDRLRLQEIASCVAGYDPNALPVAQAQEFIARLVPRVAGGREAWRCARRSAACWPRTSSRRSTCRRTTTRRWTATRLRGADLRADGETRAAVAGTGFAGAPLRRRGRRRPVRAHHDRRGHAGRAATPSCRRSSCRVDGDARRASRAGVVRAGDNRRLAGEDLARGEAALHAGRRAAPGRPRPARLARPAPRCRCCAACASPSSPPATSCARSASRSTPGCVYDSNRYTLWGMLQRLGVRRASTWASCATIRPRSKPRSRSAGAQRRRGHHLAAASASARPTTRKQVMAQLGDVLFWQHRDAAGAADGVRPHRDPAAAAPCCSACPATRWP